ncbi:MAG: hypothetical protein U0R66_07205 [Mycobacterium sp.]
MTRRRALLVGGVVVVLLAAGVWFFRSSHRTASGCDTVHAMLAYNSQFAEQMKSSTAPDKAGAVAPEQYREWASTVKDYAGQISDPELSGKAQTAADLAGRLADLVPRYRAKPDDPAAAREYADLGIQYGNAISRLDYACLPAG